MAVTLRSLCEKASYRYGMRVIAGNDGLSNIVQWVHTVEDVEVGEFLHGGELIFSTGIANPNRDWLLPFVKNLIDRQVSGLVINIGPYIKTVPKEVIDYCNEMNFPLMDIPWKTRIVDISRDFCKCIILSEREEEGIGETLRNIVFFPGNIEEYIPVLESHNFDRNANYCLIAVNIESESDTVFEKAILVFERIICSLKKHWGGFRVDSTIYYVICDSTDKEIDDVVNRIQNQQNNDASLKKIFIAVGLPKCNISSLNKSYQITSRMVTLAGKKDISPIYYEKLGVKKIILAVDNQDVLKAFYNEHLLSLETYDNENGTDYMNFLRLYFKYDGSIQKLAEETFVHRNTINYQLSKIKKIIGSEIKTFDERFKLMLALQIKETL